MARGGKEAELVVGLMGKPKRGESTGPDEAPELDDPERDAEEGEESSEVQAAKSEAIDALKQGDWQTAIDAIFAGCKAQYVDDQLKKG